MFGTCLFFALIIGIVFQHAVHAELLGANDRQTCIQLCAGCDGTATFEGLICQCHVADDNRQGAECLARLKRQASELGVDLVSCEPANAERPARCLLGSCRTNANPCLVAQYFKNGGPLNAIRGFGPFVGSLNPNTAVDNNVLTAKNSNSPSNKYPSNPNDTPVGSANPGTMDTDSQSSTPWERQTVGAASNVQNPSLGNLLGYNSHPNALDDSSSRFPNLQNGILGAILAPHNSFGPMQQQNGPADGNLQEMHGQGQSPPAMDSMQNNMVGVPDYGRFQDSHQPMHGYVQDQNSMNIQPPAAVAAANPQYAATNPQYAAHNPQYAAHNPQYAARNPQYVMIDPMVGAPIGWPYYVIQNPLQPGQLNSNGSPDVGAANPMAPPIVNPNASPEAAAPNPDQSPDSAAPNPVGSPKTTEEVPKDKEPEAGHTAENVGESQRNSAESAAEEKPEKKTAKKYTKDPKVGSVKSKKMKDSVVGAAGPDSTPKLNKMKKTKESGNESEGHSPDEKNKETVSEPKLNKGKAKERDGEVASSHGESEANNDGEKK